MGSKFQEQLSDCALAREREAWAWRGNRVIHKERNRKVCTGHLKRDEKRNSAYLADTHTDMK